MNKNKCDSKIKISDFNSVEKKVSYILKNQKARKEFIKKRYLDIRFNFGMRSKTKYGQKALKSAYYNTLSIISSMYKSNYTDKLNKALSKILHSKIYNKDVLSILMNYIDLGYRMRKRVDPLTVLINLIMFGLTIVNDWQFYLSTPLGIKLLSEAFNGDIKQQEELVKIFINVSCNGVSPSDILSFIPKIPGLDICNENKAYFWFIDKGLRQIIYRISLYTECPKKMLNYWVIKP